MIRLFWQPEPCDLNQVSISVNYSVRVYISSSAVKIDSVIVVSCTTWRIRLPLRSIESSGFVFSSDLSNHLPITSHLHLLSSSSSSSCSCSERRVMLDIISKSHYSSFIPIVYKGQGWYALGGVINTWRLWRVQQACLYFIIQLKPSGMSPNLCAATNPEREKKAPNWNLLLTPLEEERR